MLKTEYNVKMSLSALSVLIGVVMFIFALRKHNKMLEENED